MSSEATNETNTGVIIEIVVIPYMVFYRQKWSAKTGQGSPNDEEEEAPVLK